MSHFLYSLNRTAARAVLAHPETYIYACMLAGMVLGLGLMGGIGYVLCLPFHQGLLGFYVGCFLYGLWFIQAMPVMQALVHQQIQQIKQLRG